MGYIEGKNILSEYRFYGEQFERIPTVVNELVQSKVDVLVLEKLPGYSGSQRSDQDCPYRYGHDTKSRRG